MMQKLTSPCPKRILGTPNEEIWPSVSSLPDYKPTFPQWSRQDVARIVSTLDEAGIDMLKVRELSNLPYIILITLFLLSSVPLRMILPNVFLVRFFVLPIQGAIFLFLFKQNERLHILISQIIDLKLSISIPGGPGHFYPIRYYIPLSLLSVDACNVFSFSSFLPPRIHFFYPNFAREYSYFFIFHRAAPIE